MIKIDKIAVGAMMTNCYIISDMETRDAVILDPGAAAERIAQTVKQNEYELRAILLTHGHFDHILAADELRCMFAVKLYCSEAEQDILADPVQNVGRMFHCACSLIPDQVFQDQEELRFGALSCKVIATPGHTKGGVSFYFEEDKALFSGDTLFFESVGNTEFPTGNAQILINSIRERLFVLPEETKVYPGHGPATTIAYEIENNPYVNEEGYRY